jgi:Protein of unknown function (DUF2752)
MKKNKLYVFMIIACFLGFLWLFFLNFTSKNQFHTNFTVCLLKRFTGYPCPSCGTSRAVATVLNGNIIHSIAINPFGILVVIIMIVSPILILFDFISKKETFYQLYLFFEKKLKTKSIAIFLTILVLFNWIWNIKKQL